MKAKSNLEADELRVAGNVHYKSSRFFDALIFYNKSLAMAIPGSKEFSLALANRSAVYMEIKENELCLENIRLAIDCGGYPEDKIKTLLERQDNCFDLLEFHESDPQKNPWSFFKLSHPPNEEIPYAANCIELRESSKLGRYLITNRSLKTGDIICIEEPFHKFIVNSSRFSHCANCLKSEKLNLFPCLECHFTMFCSKDCMTIAQRFHHFQCRVVHVRADEENDIFEVAHRNVFEALGIFGKIGKLQKFIEGHSGIKTVFDFNLAKGDAKEIEKNLLQAVNSLQGNPIPESIYSLMDGHVKIMQSITDNKKHKKFLDSFMRKQMEIIVTNSFGLVDKNQNEIGSGIFPLASFFNHSCAPNVSRTTVDNKLVFIVSRPIKKNQQLFVCYRGNFSIDNKIERQKELRKSYKFDCTCEACFKNYPTLKNNFTDDLSFSEPPSTITSVESAKAELKQNCDYIDKYHKNFPNFEICTLMERNRNLLAYIAEIASVPR